MTSFEPSPANPQLREIPAWLLALDRSAEFREGMPANSANDEIAQPNAIADGPKIPPAFEEGRQAGFDEAQKAINARSEAVVALTSQIGRLDDAMIRALQTRLVEVVSKLCEAVLAPHAVDVGLLKSRCESIAKTFQLPVRDLNVFLHPEDIALLDCEFREAWAVKGDPNIIRGTILVEAAGRIIRDGPDDWQRAIEAALRG